MSERLDACRALAAMVRDHGETNVDEARFVAHAGLQFGLAPDEHEVVQKTLAEGGDYGEFLSRVTDPDLRRALFRAIVSAVLFDDQINDKEQGYIDKAAKSFGYAEDVVVEFVAWLRDGLAWERRGVSIMERM
jgi:hypothetical protein